MKENAPAPFMNWLEKHWFLIFVISFGLWVWIPFLAPLFMRLGWDIPAKIVYTIYSFFCHQLPERSFFFFGPKVSYSLSEIQAAWMDTINPLLLRKFIGTPEMGWKIAWSDRMISLFGGIWLAALIWYPLRSYARSLPALFLALFLLPMILDGSSHFISDLTEIGLGFRDSNLWLANLTRFNFSPSFYAGDGLGSFNSWMRLVTGLLAGVGLVWFVFPYLDAALSE